MRKVDLGSLFLVWNSWKNTQIKFSSLNNFFLHGCKRKQESDGFVPFFTNWKIMLSLTMFNMYVIPKNMRKIIFKMSLKFQQSWTHTTETWICSEAWHPRGVLTRMTILIGDLKTNICPKVFKKCFFWENFKPLHKLWLKFSK